MEQDGGFRNFLIGSSEMDELSQSLNYLGHPLMDWLVLFDPENWPESKSFGVMLDSSKKTCQRSKSESGIERHVVFPRNSSLPYSQLRVQCLNVELKSFSPFQRLLVVSSDFQQSQLLKKSRRNMEKTNSLTPITDKLQVKMMSEDWQQSEIGFREAVKGDMTKLNKTTTDVGNSIFKPCDESIDFQCKSDRTFCVPKYWLCDGVADCPNGSDEESVMCKALKTSNLSKQASVSNANIEEDQSVLKKDLNLVEVAELEPISKQNLDRNAHFSGPYYETSFYIVLGLCLVFIFLIVLLLSIYFYARKKTVNSDDQNPPIRRPENEPERLDDEIEAIEKSVLEPLPYSIKPPRVTEFPKEFAKAYSKGEALSLGVSWDFPFVSGFPEKLQTPPRRQQSIIKEGDVDHHPDFYNHTPLVMSPSRLNKSCP